MKILLVENEQKNLFRLESILKNKAYEVVSISNGKDALNFALENPLDIIISNLLLKGIDGFQFCKNIKKNEKLRNIPFIFYSDFYISDEMEKFGLKLGADLFINRYIMPERLIKTIEELNGGKSPNLKVSKKQIQSNSLSQIYDNDEGLIAKLKQKVAELETKQKRLIAEKEELLRKTKLLKKVQVRMLHREKMASIGQLAAGIAHELNNPVGFVASNFETLGKNVSKFVKIIERYHELGNVISNEGKLIELFNSIEEEKEAMHLDFILEDLDDLFEDSKKGFEQITQIITSLRNFSRIDDFEEKVLYNINDGLKDTLIIARNEYKYNCEVETDFGDIPLTLCTPGAINQVFLIIIVNAAHAISSQEMDGKGYIRIQTYRDEKYIICKISNDGPTISKRIKSKIFDPFFTTKETGKGTGLGLSIAYDIIVNKHKGDLSVESKPNKDTTFIIKIPIE